MTLVSWNVDKRTTRQLEQIETIAGTGADVVALQEVTQSTVSGFCEHLAKVGLPNVVSTDDPELLVASRWALKPGRVKFEIPSPQRDILSVIVLSPYGEIELHTTHVPNKGNPKDDRKKIDTCRGIYRALAIERRHHRILCGDLNIPKEEHSDGTVRSFFPHNNPEGRAAEISVICDLAEFDLKDTFRLLHGYRTEGYSWMSRTRKRFRLDHILSSESLNAVACEYIHKPREVGLSDHSMIYATFEPERC